MGRSATPLPAAEQIALATAVAQRNDRAAADRLVRTNMGILHSRVRRLAWREAPDVQEECLSEAMLGFIEGLQRFDPARGFAPITYAVHYVDMRIRTYLARQTTLSVGSRVLHEPQRQSTETRRAVAMARQPAIPLDAPLSPHSEFRPLDVVRSETDDPEQALMAAEEAPPTPPPTHTPPPRPPPVAQGKRVPKTMTTRPTVRPVCYPA